MRTVTVPFVGLAGMLILVALVAAGVALAVVELRDGDNSPSMQAATLEGTPAPDDILNGGGSEVDRAKLLGQQYLYDFAARNVSSDEHAALTEGFSPQCDAKEHTDSGWLIHCELRRPDGTSFERAFDLVVEPDGTVSANAGGS